MHSVIAALAPVLAAEKSKTPFYVAGALLVAWALVVSLVLGLRKDDFPYSLRGQWIVSAITAVLVVAAASTAVITAGGEENTEAATGPESTTPEAPAQPAPPAGSASAPAPAPAAPAQTTTQKAAPAPAKPTVTKLQLAANTGGQLLYNTKQLNAKAGSVTINFANESPVEHDVTIAEGKKLIGATPVFTGGSKSLTLQLKPGTYTFFCSVPGHRQAGMEGTLTVS